MTRHQAIVVLALLIGGQTMQSACAEEPYRLPPRVIEAPGENHSVDRRRFQGIPSMAISPEGRLWATWYAGTSPSEQEADRQHDVAASLGSSSMSNAGS